MSSTHKGEILFRWKGFGNTWKTYGEDVWKDFGDRKIHDYYVGSVVNEKPNGLGIMIYVTDKEIEGDTEKKYIGEWKDGKRNGRGTYTDSIVKYKYEGYWMNDEQHGWGTEICGNYKYKGEWVKGKRNGQGKQKYFDGSWCEGEWKDDHNWNTVCYRKKGEIKLRYVKGRGRPPLDD